MKQGFWGDPHTDVLLQEGDHVGGAEVVEADVHRHDRSLGRSRTPREVWSGDQRPGMLGSMKAAARRLTLEIVGWTLLLAGIAALVLPGPGLLMVFAGMAVLSQQYDWAERRVEPLRLRAMRAAAYGVAKPSRIVASGLGVLWMWAWGVVWCLQPSVPSWWSLPDSFWLPGGLATGVSLVASGFLALALLAWSYRRFHGQPEELRELERDIDRADAA